MAEYIERKAVMDALLHEQYGYLCEDAIRSIPAADVRPVVRGKWEQVDDYRYPWGCTNCRTTFSGRYNFCPNCGADMREAADETVST